MGINVLRVELVREIGNLKTYKITYQEETEVEQFSIVHVHAV